MSPSEITALCGGIAAIVAAYVGGGKVKEKKIYRENGFERREDTISLSTYEQCKKSREDQEKTLFTGQGKLEKRMETNRTETREDFKGIAGSIDTLAAEARNGRGEIFGKLDELTRVVYKQEK